MPTKLSKLTKDQLNSAMKAWDFKLVEDDHLVELWYKGLYMVDRFNAVRVTLSAIYNSMKAHLIKIGKIDEDGELIQ